jgi:hypothetical protein
MIRGHCCATVFSNNYLCFHCWASMWSNNGPQVHCCATMTPVIHAAYPHKNATGRQREIDGPVRFPSLNIEREEHLIKTRETKSRGEVRQVKREIMKAVDGWSRGLSWSVRVARRAQGVAIRSLYKMGPTATLPSILLGFLITFCGECQLTSNASQ